MLLEVLNLLFVVAVVSFNDELLVLLEEIVNLKVAHEVRISIVPDDFSLADLLLECLTSTLHYLIEHYKTVGSGFSVPIRHVSQTEAE